VISPKRRARNTSPSAPKRRPAPGAAQGSLNVVRDILQAYADRGVFRGFSEIKSRQGLPTFRFVWLIQHRMELTVDIPRHELRFKQLLPGVAARSPLYAELKDLLRDLRGGNFPEHRRIDPRRAEVSCSSQRGFVSISLTVKDNEYAYGVNRIVNLVHELFVHLRDAWPDYLVEHFHVAQE